MATSGFVAGESFDGLRSRELAVIFNGAAPGVLTPILATILGSGIQIEDRANTLRVTIALTTGSVLWVTCTDGSTTHKWKVNSGVALGAELLHAFVWGARSKDQNGNALTYDLELGTDSVIEYLSVEEVYGGVF